MRKKIVFGRCDFALRKPEDLPASVMCFVVCPGHGYCESCPGSKRSLPTVRIPFAFKAKQSQCSRPRALGFFCGPRLTTERKSNAE